MPVMFRRCTARVNGKRCLFKTLTTKDFCRKCWSRLKKHGSPEKYRPWGRIKEKARLKRERREGTPISIEE